MKKSLSVLLAALMLLSSISFLASAQESAPIVFDLIEEDGSIPYGKGRNGDCYFPKDSSKVNCEVYTWNQATKLISVDGYAAFSASGAGMLEFDTFPSDKSWSAKKKLSYLVMNVKSGKVAQGISIAILAQGAKYKKNFNINFTGEWQQIILDLNEPSGWYVKDEGGTYVEAKHSPMNKDGTQVMTGGFRMDLPGESVIGTLMFDYIGIFASEAQAKSYKGRQTPTGTDVITEKPAEADSSEVATGEVDIGNAIIFKLIEEDGTIPFGKGRNGDCFFQKGSSTENPEVYTWSTGVLSAEEGFSAFYPGAVSSMLELDTFPDGKSWSADKKLTYIAYTVKTSSAEDTTITVVAQGGKFKKTFNVKYTGEWQRIVLDLNNPDGWTSNGLEVGYSPMKNPEGTQVMTGGFRLDFPGNTIINSYKFDFVGLFGSLNAAKNYTLRQSSASISVYDGTNKGTTTQGTTAEVKPEEKLPEKPKMKDALTRGEEPADNSITLVSAVDKSIVEDDKIVYKYSKMGIYDDATKKFPVEDDPATSYLQTWGAGTFENTTAGVLKFVSAAGGKTLFEAHPSKSPNPSKHIYMLIGYKTNEDYSSQKNTAYLLSSGNEYKYPFNVSIDSEWHYDIIDITKLEAYSKESNYKEKTTDKSKLNFGAFRIDFPVVNGIVFYIDYIGFFANEDDAKEFVAKSEEAAGISKDAAPAEEEKFVYMKGYDDGTFRPGAQMTRAEACTVVARLLADEEEIAKERETSFTDVKKGDWYYNYVTYLEELGYLPNYSGEFNPSKNITRSEFIKLTFEAGGLEFSMKRPQYIDLDKNHPYYKEIVFASGTGIVTGYDNGDGTMSFKPDGEITRAEIATVVNRILGISPLKEASQEFSDLDNTHWAFGTVMAIASKN